MRANDLEYYRRRLVEELERSFDAESEVARTAHRTLAELYRARLNEPAPTGYRAMSARVRAA
ncbi:hypothetical protein [Rhizorhabdus dicambivorans]|nr:hypothetical protein [Rhizorhabdus dicambivorans]